MEEKKKDIIDTRRGTVLRTDPNPIDPKEITGVIMEDITGCEFEFSYQGRIKKIEKGDKFNFELNQKKAKLKGRLICK